ncbi:MAG: insulinase family protein [Oligoflexia bacterium]|nr:insulinase family protein [Oligoflexia bacterium]
MNTNNQKSIEIQQLDLKNNLKTVFVNSRGSSVGCVQIWFRVGSVYESKKEKNLGMAHFLEHMFFKNNQPHRKMPIVKEIENYGGEINAFTSFDYTCYYINTPNNYLIKSTELLLEMVSNPLFKEDDIHPEREVVFEEYRRSLDGPGQVAFRRLQLLCFPGSYRNSILGEETTIKNFNRKALVKFKNSFYTFSNALLVVAGDFESDKYRGRIIDTIESFKIKQKHTFKQTTQVTREDLTKFELKKKSSFEIHQKDVNMSQLTIAIAAKPFASDQAPNEELALNILGYGETSILYKELVTKKMLANGVSCSTMYLGGHLRGGGTHFIKLSAPPEKLNDIFNSISNILQQTLKSGFLVAELEKIKNQYLAVKIYDKESLESFAYSLGNNYCQTNDIYGENNFLEKVANANLEDVNAAFKDILSRNIYASLQIPENLSIETFKLSVNKFHDQLVNLSLPIHEPSTATATSTTGLTSKSKLTINKSKFDPNAFVCELFPGIKLIYRQNTITPTFAIHAYIKGGLVCENEENNGIHNIISNVITRGYTGVSYNKLQTELEGFSSSLNGICGKNTYGLTMHGLSKFSNKLFGHFFESLLNPTFATKEIKHEREMIYRLLKNQQKDPIKQCFKLVSKLIFKNHPYSLDIEGSKKNLARFCTEELINTHKMRLNSSEILVAYCGSMTFEKFYNYAIDPLSRLYKQRISNNLKFLKSETSKIKQKLEMDHFYGQKEFLEFAREQSQIFVGLPTFDMKNKNEIYLKILTTLLSGQSSTLFTKMRDQLGLCYTVSPVHFSALNGGYFGIYMASGYDKSMKALDELKKFIENIKNGGIKEREFNTIKSMIEGQTKLSLQYNDDYASTYSIPELHGIGIDHIYKVNELIKKATYKNFHQFISQFLSQPLNVVVVGKK